MLYFYTPYYTLSKKEFQKRDEKGKVNINTLLDGKEISTGNGTDTDIYKVTETTTDEDEVKTYKIEYLDNAGSSKENGILEDNTKLAGINSSTGETGEVNMIEFEIYYGAYYSSDTPWGDVSFSPQFKVKCPDYINTWEEFIDSKYNPLVKDVVPSFSLETKYFQKSSNYVTICQYYSGAYMCGPSSSSEESKGVLLDSKINDGDIFYVAAEVS